MKKSSSVGRLCSLAFAMAGAGMLLIPTVQGDTNDMDKVEPASKMRMNSVYRDDKVVDDKVIEENVAARQLFREKEFSIDIFGLYAFEAEEGAYEDGFGPGLGINYFINRYVGFGLEGYWWNGDDVISSVSGNLILRYPIEEWHLAPYLIGGIGGNFDADDGRDQINASGGIGVEYRFTENWSIFTDARYVATEKENDYAVTRTGVRFAF